MKRLILAAALVSGAVSPAFAADEPQLDLEQRSLLRCSAVFAIIANEQSRGIESALAWPRLTERGKEYFVQAGARLIESHQLTHEQVEALYRAEIKHLQDESFLSPEPEKFVASLMEPCLLSLDASGL